MQQHAVVGPALQQAEPGAAVPQPPVLEPVQTAAGRRRHPHRGAGVPHHQLHGARRVRARLAAGGVPVELQDVAQRGRQRVLGQFELAQQPGRALHAAVELQQQRALVVQDEVGAEQAPVAERGQRLADAPRRGAGPGQGERRQQGRGREVAAGVGAEGRADAFDAGQLDGRAQHPHRAVRRDQDVQVDRDALDVAAHQPGPAAGPADRLQLRLVGDQVGALAAGTRRRLHHVAVAEAPAQLPVVERRDHRVGRRHRPHRPQPGALGPLVAQHRQGQPRRLRQAGAEHVECRAPLGFHRGVGQQRQLPAPPGPGAGAGAGDPAQHLVDTGTQRGVVAHPAGRLQRMEERPELALPARVRALHAQHGGQAAGAQQRQHEQGAGTARQPGHGPQSGHRFVTGCDHPRDYGEPGTAPTAAARPITPRTRHSPPPPSPVRRIRPR